MVPQNTFADEKKPWTSVVLWNQYSGSVATDKFIDEFKLRAWIIEQNGLKGFASPNNEMGTFYDEAIIGNHGIPILPLSRADMQLA